MSNKLSQETIKELLDSEYKYHLRKFGENQVLGTFCVGKANYGFAETADDLHFITVTLPTFEELCIKDTAFTKNNHKTKYGEIYDIRELYFAAQTISLTALELLFCNDYIITTKYKDIFMEKLYAHREDFGRYNEQSRLARCLFNAETALQNDNLFELIRMSVSAKMYANGNSIDDCFHIPDPIYRSYITSFMNGELAIDKDKLIQEINTLVINAKDDEKYVDVIKLLKDGILSIMWASLMSNITLETFVESLTATERKAFNYVQSLMESNNECTLSIVKSVELTGISRPIFKNLFMKMAQDKVAVIENHGVKGTYVKMLL